MKLNLYRTGGVRSERGVALVVTLLMLSVITFLAIAFLAMTQRDRAAATATLDVDGARNMSDAALSRAQAEIVAHMIARGDALSYDYMVSRNYINPFGFTNKGISLLNVNYDFLFGSGVPVGRDATIWAENIGNLYYDPRPPVFVVTNPAFPASNDFRFWVDINRNGRFETNGYLPYMTENNGPTTNYQWFNGEPEWIGMLRDPLNRHSSSNIFIGRYAYMVLPIGKTLDLNYIHNWLKGMYSDSVTSLTNNYQAYVSDRNRVEDGFARDAGMGSWELNLAAMLDVLSTNAYESGFPGGGTALGYNSTFSPYLYNIPVGAGSLPNQGSAFADAESILHYRYYPLNNTPSSWVPTGLWPYYFMASLNQASIPSLSNNDLYCVAAPFTNDYNPAIYASQLAQPTKVPWPGSYTTNMFYDVQDLFDQNKTSPAFSNRLAIAGSRTNSEDRYTFERMLQNIGMGSQPEYGVWVYETNGTQILRTKINLNYDNSAQIAKGPYSPTPTNLVNWTPLGFFTNAADLLLRSQTYNYAWTNYARNAAGQLVGTSVSSTNLYFGVTNIPVFRVYEPGVQYNEAVHRMLQLAANIYSDGVATNTNAPAIANGLLVRHPFVFEPLFGIVGVGTSNWGVDIIGFTNVINSANILNQIEAVPYVDLNSNNFINGSIARAVSGGYNLSGVPWVVSMEKGLPQFYQFDAESRLIFSRKILFYRADNGSGQPVTNKPAQYTNQFFIFGISNSVAASGFNPYKSQFLGSLNSGSEMTYFISNYITVTLTNNFGYGFTNSYTNGTRLLSLPKWTAWSGDPIHRNTSGGFLTFITNAFTTLPLSYYSERSNKMVFFTNANVSDNSFSTADLKQTSWAVHNWVLSVTNHLVYALFDGSAISGNGALLDYVNLGPFGYSTNITQLATITGDNHNGGQPSSDWNFGSANDTLGSMYPGLINQIYSGVPGDDTYNANLTGTGNVSPGWTFGPDYNPSNAWNYAGTFVANDPMVHYTIGDLTWPANSVLATPIEVQTLIIPMTNVTLLSPRYQAWGVPGAPNDMLLEDSMLTSPSAWQFPSNKYPSIGWLGRVHRGTPWQTVYFKSDNPKTDPLPTTWLNWVNSPDTYPTNDWAIPDLFTTAPNDNAARGLLSVNQTNDAAWAAVLAGVMMPTNSGGSLIGRAIGPSNIYSFVDGPGGFNETRTNEPNGLFHKLGYILKSPALTVGNMFISNNAISTFPYSDEVEERIPQQILGLLKVGEPQFVIYAWGESLRPKARYLGISSQYSGIVTNYEITGEFLSRTVCHVVHTNTIPKMVIDSYNVVPAD